MTRRSLRLGVQIACKSGESLLDLSRQLGRQRSWTSLHCPVGRTGSLARGGRVGQRVYIPSGVSRVDPGSVGRGREGGQVIVGGVPQVMRHDWLSWRQ